MLLKSIVFCLSLVFSVSQLSAAEITQRPDLAPRLAQLKPLYPGKGSTGSVVNELQGTIFLISGVIEKGDLEKLKAALDGTWGKFIVFDSPGGSFLEGIRIGQYLQYNVGSQDRISTVSSFSTVMSACPPALSPSPWQLPRATLFMVAISAFWKLARHSGTTWHSCRRRRPTSLWPSRKP